MSFFTWRRRRDSQGSALLSLREKPIMFGFAEGVRVSLINLQQKQKGYPEGYPFYLAQKERLELSRRFPDLRP